MTLYNSQKSFVLTNLSPIGGQSPVLSVAHIIGGVFNIVFGILLIYIHRRETVTDYDELK